MYIKLSIHIYIYIYLRYVCTGQSKISGFSVEHPSLLYVHQLVVHYLEMFLDITQGLVAPSRVVHGLRDLSESCFGLGCCRMIMDVVDFALW